MRGVSFFGNSLAWLTPNNTSLDHIPFLWMENVSSGMPKKYIPGRLKSGSETDQDQNRDMHQVPHHCFADVVPCSGETNPPKRSKKLI